MARLNSAEELVRLRDSARENARTHARTGTKVIVGIGTCGIAAGAQETQDAILRELEKYGIDAEVSGVGCIGMCSKEPLVDIQQAGYPRITYCNVTANMVPRLVREHLVEGNVVQDWVMGRVPPEGIGRLDVAKDL